MKSAIHRWRRVVAGYGSTVLFASFGKWFLLFVFVVMLAVAGVMEPVMAQPSNADPVPRNDEAEALFQQALQAFDEADYGMAARRFRVVYQQYPLHRKTTAAVLMEGKARYRNGEYQQAVDLFTAFRRDYPSSGYREAVGRALGFAQQKLREEQMQDGAIRMGIALPMTRDDVPLTQSLFNGIRLAANEHNRTGRRPVQMVFRDTENTPGGARRAVEALVNDEVDVIIGPLYSDEARAAAQTTERAQVVMIAPLATDERVSQGRRYVFQANPTIASRGTAMARLVVNDLQLRSVGIVAESGNSISERMAEGFQEEAERLGANVAFFELLTSSRDWMQLPDLVGEETLASVDAVYLPIHREFDRDAHRIMEETLTSLGRQPQPPRVLGGSKWHDVAFKSQATAAQVTYTDVFYVDLKQSEVQAFRQGYRDLTSGEQPGRLAYVGYDVARYLMDHLDDATDTLRPETLHEADLYEGLGSRIQFVGGNTNTAMFVLQYERATIVRLR